MKIPKIGLRIIKSAIVVFLCFVVCYIRLYLPIPIPESGIDGMAFYAAIAAILCMQKDVSGSIKVAWNRTVGTFLGGCYAMVIMTFLIRVVTLNHMLIRYTVISLAIIPLIYLTVLIRKTSATFITCVVFLSVTISHGADAHPYWFALNRIFDTLLGIFLSLGINTIPFLRPREKGILFVSDLDGTLLNSFGELSRFTEKKLNYMLRRGANITIATARTPATIVPLMERIELNLPVIAMNGAVFYDLKKMKYVSVKEISCEVSIEIVTLFQREGTNCFVHTIQGNNLIIYHSDFTNPIEKAFYDARKHLPGKQYVYGRLPEGRKTVYFTAIGQLETMSKLNREIDRLECSNQIHTTLYEDVYHEGYYFLEIYHHAASKKNAVLELKQQLQMDKVVAFGDNNNDLSMMEAADVGYAVENATDLLKESVDTVLKSNDADVVAKEINRIFFVREQL